MRKYLHKSIISILFIGLVLVNFSCEKKAVPILTTSAITNITTASAIGGGTITDEGSGTVIVRGVCWSTSNPPTIDDNVTQNGVGAGNFSSTIGELNGGTLYYVRAYATNSTGTGYGMAMSFTTLGQLPTPFTIPASNITSRNATLNGTVNGNYLSTIVTFEYGTTTNYGSTITATNSPVAGNINTIVSADISGLTELTIYHFRAKARNSIGTSYGSDMTFTTTSFITVTDVDGNTYNTVTIGSQVWFQENLKTTKYNDGTAIPNVTDNTAWTNLITGAYCWYNNDETNKNTYGALYNWFAVDNNSATKVASNGSKNVCPTGWHIPTDVEWTTLIDFLIINGYNWDGTVTDNKIAKSLASTSGWTTWPIAGTVGNDQASNNRTGFTALPGGARSGTMSNLEFGKCFGFGNSVYWWSSTESSTNLAYSRYFFSNYAYVTREGSLYKSSGFSVRCIKD